MPGGLVLDIVRIRLADGIPISLERVQLPAEIFPGLLELPLGGSIYELLDTRYGIRPEDVVEHLEVAGASARPIVVKIRPVIAGRILTVNLIAGLMGPTRRVVRSRRWQAARAYLADWCQRTRPASRWCPASIPG